MGKGTLGVLTALAVWCGGALSVEAQIDVSEIGPASVYSDQTTMTVTANVSGYTSYNYWVKVKIGTATKHYSYGQAGSGSQIVYPITGLQSWPISNGTVLEIIVKAWVGSQSDTETRFVTVTNPPPPPPPPGTFMPEHMRPRKLGIRDEALAWLDRKACQVIG